MALKAASDRGRMQEAMAVDGNSNDVEGAQVLEQMLDDERTAIEVCIDI